MLATNRRRENQSQPWMRGKLQEVSGIEAQTNLPPFWIGAIYRVLDSQCGTKGVPEDY